MNRFISTSSTPAAAKGWLGTLLIAASLALGASTVQAGPGKVLSPSSTIYGKKYSEWSAAWWQWAMEHPVAGHPFVDDAAFDVTSGQSGDVWFLGSPFGAVERTCTIPAGKAIFVGMLNAEASDLEGLGATAEEQAATAAFFADHIVDLTCVIDGVAVNKIEKYRTVSPQFTFNAPTPWIFGEVGGTGTSVADGYYILIAPLPPGQHVLHWSGGFHFSVAEGDPFDFDAELDVTYHLNVQ